MAQLHGPLPHKGAFPQSMRVVAHDHMNVRDSSLHDDNRVICLGFAMRHKAFRALPRVKAKHSVHWHQMNVSISVPSNLPGEHRRGCGHRVTRGEGGRHFSCTRVGHAPL